MTIVIPSGRDEESRDSSINFLTFPSISASIFEVPEPKDIGGNFVYNYFLQDERESSDTFVSEEQFKLHGKKYARQVEIFFEPLSNVIPNNDVMSTIQISNRQKQLLLERNVDKITKETEFTSGQNVSLKLQDTTVATDLLANIEALLLKKKVDTFALSPMETVLQYSSQTTANLDGQEMLDSVNVDDSNEYITIDPATGEEFEVQKSGELDKLTFNMNVSKRFAGDVATTAVKTPLSPTAEMFSGCLSELIEEQSKSRRNISSCYVTRSNFLEMLNPVLFSEVATDTVFLGGNTIMGYHITRVRTDDDTDIEHFFITNDTADNFVDTTVMYGYTYQYAISVIYLFRVFGFRADQLVFADILIESRESPSINIACKEIIPPQAPDDLRFYMLQSEQLIVEWAFPINRSKDIKRFQVYRRSDINLPFLLLGELDFDDSTIQTDRSEGIYDTLVTKIDTPRTYFNDPYFDLDSNFIYAVCAVDAHDLSSPYSEQFRVWFNKVDGKLETEFISEKNAPKPYPNFLLRQELLENIVKDSNHSALSCYFDPEYLKVVNGDGQDLNFLQRSEDNVSYKLQLIHLNFQQSVIADINVK